MKFRRKSADPVETDGEVSAEVETPATGPFDLNDAPADSLGGLDIGSLLVPPVPGYELRLQIDEATEEVRAAMLTKDDGALELRAFAAPRGGDLWTEVRPKIAADFAQRGGTATEREGIFGTELVCQLTVKTADGRTGTQPSRIIGVNGSRWMLRATLLGKPAVDADAAGEWEDVIQRVVVRRGDSPMPSGAELPLRVPADRPVPDSVDDADSDD